MQILMCNDVPEFRHNNLSQKYDSDIGYDIRAGGSYSLPPGCSKKIYTGLHIHLPKYLGGIVQSRSGLAFNENVEASNAGVIDSGYHDICWVKLYNHSNDYTREINKGDRIAQIIFHINVKHFAALLDAIFFGKTRMEGFHIIETTFESFPTTARQNNGLGSTGKD